MININLLPPEIKLKLKQAQKSADVFSICLVIIVIFAVAGFLLKALDRMLLAPNLAATKNNIQKARSQLNSFGELEDQAVFLNERAELATKIEEKRAVWSQITQELINSVPQEVQFTNLNVNQDKTPNFVLQGKTNSERDIIKFKEKLDNSAFFKNVAFKSSSTEESTDQSKQTKIRFTLEFDLEKYAVAAKTAPSAQREVK